MTRDMTEVTLFWIYGGRHVVLKIVPFTSSSSGSILTSSFEMVRCMVANGHGYSVLNQRPAISQSYDGGEIAMVELSDRVPTLNVVLLSLRDSRLTRKAQAISDFCRGFYPQKK